MQRKKKQTTEELTPVVEEASPVETAETTSVVEETNVVEATPTATEEASTETPTETATATTTETTTTTAKPTASLESSTYGVTLKSSTFQSSSNSYNFSYIYDYFGSNVHWYGANATIWNEGAGISNVIGNTIYYGRASGFGWTFKGSEGSICVGLYQNSTISSEALTTSLLDKAQVICSDNTYYNLGAMAGVKADTSAATTWTMSIDLLSLSFNITNKNGQGYFGFINDINTTYYVVLFKEPGLIKFSANLTVIGTSMIKKIVKGFDALHFPFDWLNVYSDKSAIQAVPAVGEVQSLDTDVDNVIGQSIVDGSVVHFSWTFLQVETYSCVGLISTADPASLSLTTDIRSESIAICSDNTKYGVTTGTDSAIERGTSWEMNIDPIEGTMNFTETTSGRSGFYTAAIPDIGSTYYTFQFSGYGAILLGNTITRVVIQEP